MDSMGKDVPFHVVVDHPTKKKCSGKIVIRRTVDKMWFVESATYCTNSRCIRHRKKYFDNNDSSGNFIGVDDEIRGVTNNATFIGCNSLQYDVISKVLLHIIKVRQVPIVRVLVDKSPRVTWESPPLFPVPTTLPAEDEESSSSNNIMRVQRRQRLRRRQRRPRRQQQPQPPLTVTTIVTTVLMV